MKVYIKIHRRNGIETIACCDELLIDQIFKEGNLQIEINSQFFGDTLLEIEEAIELLKSASNFNIVGENITQQAITQKILPKEGVRKINGIPMALKMMI